MSNEKAYPTDPAGELDAGADSETRARPCTKRTWCQELENHDGPCVETPRKPYERQDWDKRLPDPRGWAEAAARRSK